ncbi:MAG TPA: hypothetical protein VFN71_14435 [Methylomirabilota bacterium]|nr:hypothetical protein [Methylomirabilota bacterium]
MKKRRARKAQRRRAQRTTSTPRGGRRAPVAPSGRDPLLAPIAGADRRTVAGVTVDSLRAGNGRLKRLVYPPGFRWSTHMKSLVGTTLCMHAHVGFLARGHVRGQYGDGCSFEHTAPSVVVIEPGHDAWVVGKEAAVLIQFDAQGNTTRQFGLPEAHRHA